MDFIQGHVRDVMTLLRQGRERVRDRERPGSSENQAMLGIVSVVYLRTVLSILTPAELVVVLT